MTQKTHQKLLAKQRAKREASKPAPIVVDHDCRDFVWHYTSILSLAFIGAEGRLRGTRGSKYVQNRIEPVYATTSDQVDPTSACAHTQDDLRIRIALPKSLGKPLGNLDRLRDYGYTNKDVAFIKDNPVTWKSNPADWWVFPHEVALDLNNARIERFDGEQWNDISGAVGVIAKPADPDTVVLLTHDCFVEVSRTRIDGRVAKGLRHLTPSESQQALAMINQAI